MPILPIEFHKILLCHHFQFTVPVHCGHMSVPQDSSSPTIEQLQTRVNELQQQLLVSQKMGALGELSSSIAHEFNNILTTVINYAKLGLRQNDADARTKAFDKILNAGQRAAKITTGMLSYSRSSADRRDSHNLATLLKDLLVLVEKDLKVHRISLDLQIQAEPYVSVNAGQVQQVLLNLIVNARQAMQPGQTLRIVVDESSVDGMAEISVKDEGTGIPADVLPHIFDSFFTTKKADKNGQGGTGLGLALCKEVMESHSGRIRVETAVGHGTKFMLRFPQVAAPTFDLNSHVRGNSSPQPDASPVTETTFV